ncbi:MAG: ParB/RepB/Spo0J family partition protein [Lachnospiraceae bacterium]|jgi:ParB family chromosome partitioning protein|nr:ParB/RepB/Spo0J family partition protein [Lachnospiraceae bacterium]
MEKEKITKEDVNGAAAQATEIPISSIQSFRNHPFKVMDDDRMKELVQSVKDNGILNPVLVRPAAQDGFEMISGHRRMHAAKLAGLTTVPAIIKEMTDDEAVIAMVDSNMQREELLPSERAFSLKMKMDAMRRQGKRTDLSQAETKSESVKNPGTTCGTQFPKLEDENRSREQIGKESGISGRQVQKYIRLTELTEDLLNLVDQKKLPIVLAVEISRFSVELQRSLYSYIQKNGMINKTQLDALKKFNYENLTDYSLTQVLNDAVPEKKDDGKVIITRRTLDKYFSKNVTTEKRQEVILDLLDRWKRGQQKT